VILTRPNQGRNVDSGGCASFHYVGSFALSGDFLSGKVYYAKEVLWLNAHLKSQSLILDPIAMPQCGLVSGDVGMSVFL
jgi:hypothetical protein